MTDSIALDSFLDKWRSRWPEWMLLERFVAQDQRAVALAWFALVQEFDDILNIAGDPLPANAKLAWWGEELRGWAARRSRHPLGRVLEPQRAPWGELAEALPCLIDARDAGSDADAAFAGLQGHASALAAVERTLFGRERGDAVVAITAQVLAERWSEAGIAMAPHSSRTGDDAQAQERWADELLARWPVAGTPPRRLWASVARARLQASRHQPDRRPSRALPPLALVWRGWRAVQG